MLQILRCQAATHAGMLYRPISFGRRRSSTILQSPWCKSADPALTASAPITGWAVALLCYNCKKNLAATTSFKDDIRQLADLKQQISQKRILLCSTSPKCLVLNMSAKFEVSCFNRSRDIDGIPQFKKQVTWLLQDPLWPNFALLSLGPFVLNMHAKFEVSSCIRFLGINVKKPVL